MLCALIILLLEKKFEPALQSELYSHGSNFPTSKYKMKILLKDLFEDLKIANVTNSSINSKLQAIQELHNKGQCCR